MNLVIILLNTFITRSNLLIKQLHSFITKTNLVITRSNLVIKRGNLLARWLNNLITQLHTLITRLYNLTTSDFFVFRLTEPINQRTIFLTARRCEKYFRKKKQNSYLRKNKCRWAKIKCRKGIWKFYDLKIWKWVLVNQLINSLAN